MSMFLALRVPYALSPPESSPVGGQARTTSAFVQEQQRRTESRAFSPGTGRALRLGDSWPGDAEFRRRRTAVLDTENAMATEHGRTCSG